MAATLPRVRVSAKPGSEGGPAVIVVEQVGETFDYPLTVQVQYQDGQTEEITLAVTTAAVQHALSRTTAVRRVQVRDALTPVVVVR